jgi:glutathione S-transferase
MSATSELTLYHAVHSRSSGALSLLEELGVPYRLHLLDLKAGEQLRPEYLAINPMGKVPVIRDGEVVVTEQVAINIYLADRYPAAGLAPPVGDPLRGPWLRWLVFYAACFEPAMLDRAAHREPMQRAQSPYADFDTMFNALVGQLTLGPWLLGERYSSADVLWGRALEWMLQFKLVPELPVLRGYVDRVVARPAMQRAAARDAELMAVPAAGA